MANSQAFHSSHVMNGLVCALPFLIDLCSLRTLSTLELAAAVVVLVYV